MSSDAYETFLKFVFSHLLDKMINYTISYNNPHRHFVNFKLTTSTNGQDVIQFQLAAWRPGRYELADFAQNIQKWAAFDENNFLTDNIVQVPSDLRNTFRNVSRILFQKSIFPEEQCCVRSDTKPQRY